MPFLELKFKYPWRPYQRRVLDAIDHHLDDNKLHIVAAPGAGKTTLGLEVFRLLKRNALVLSPTRVIRDQWLSRLSDFCDVDDIESLDWVSRDIDEPLVLTSVTYQALYAKLTYKVDKNPPQDLEEEFSEKIKTIALKKFITKLTKNKIQVIIMDEAHHLRAEWWRAIDKVLQALPDLILVSLTATPPYDSEGHEWSKYEQLCGPIDEEISVPELVKTGTLCPHQDFIWAVNVSATEKKQIKDYDDRVSFLCRTLFDDNTFNQVVLEHPWLTQHADTNAIIKQPYIAIALLSFMKAKNLEIPQYLFVLLDLNLKEIPDFGRHQWQILIEAVLFSNSFVHQDQAKKFVEQLKKQLRSTELLHKRQLSLVRSRRIERSLSLSAAKIDACINIHKIEYRFRKNNLRQVILTDYIRDEMVSAETKIGKVNLGAWPIYREMVVASNIPEQIGMLTGRLCLIHKDRIDKLLSYCEDKKVTAKPFHGNQTFYQVSGPLNQLTTAFTELLIDGEIKVLIGTRSLLGEGWDAPVVNSLILASSVGSFMLTNQMRGRAIRIDKKVANKVSSIWHLVAIDTESQSGQRDYYNLINRFETFVGLSEKAATIESGFERLKATGLDYLLLSDFKHKAISTNNWQMIRRFRKREQLNQRWQQALTIDHSARIIPSVRSKPLPKIRHFHFKRTLSHLLVQIVTLLFFVITAAIYTSRSATLSVWVILLGTLGVLLYKLPQTIRIMRTFLDHLPVDGALKQIGIALCRSLCETNLITVPFDKLSINSIQHDDGSFYLALSGGSFYESSLFADCLAEILAPIDNPRYLITRSGKVYGQKRDDYHAVPLKLAVKKQYAETFHQAWTQYVGPSELIYTRQPAGRKQLLKAKMQAFSSVFSNETKRLDRWQ